MALEEKMLAMESDLSRDLDKRKFRRNVLLITSLFLGLEYMKKKYKIDLSGVDILPVAALTLYASFHCLGLYIQSRVRSMIVETWYNKLKE